MHSFQPTSSEMHSAAARAPVDWERFRLTAETPQEKEEVRALFFAEAEVKLGIMERCGSDAAAWRSAAHCLKGMAANLGMEPMAELCGNAERTTADADHPRAIRAELQRIMTFLAAE